MQLETQKNHQKHLLKTKVSNKRGGWKIFQLLINGVSGISMSRVELFLEINKRPPVYSGLKSMSKITKTENLPFLANFCFIAAIMKKLWSR